MSASQFIKENSLPIPIPSDPYFSYFLDLYEPILATRTKWKKFKESNGISGSPQSKEVRTEVIRHVEKNPAFKELFANADMSQYELDQKFQKQFQFSKSIYSKQYEQSYFISIDLKKANFSCLKFISSEIVEGADSYEEFMRRFTDNEHIIHSKKIRQVIFGHLNPKRQQVVQKKLMETIMRLLLEKGLFTADQFCAFTSDEIVLRVDSEKHCKSLMAQVEETLSADSKIRNVKLHLEAFFLKSISAANGKTLGFVKEFIQTNETGESTKFVFKGVPTFLYAQVYKHYIGETVDMIDRAFMHEKILCHTTNVFEERE